MYLTSVGYVCTYTCISIHGCINFGQININLFIGLSSSISHFVSQHLSSQFAIQIFQVLLYQLLLFVFDDKNLYDWKETYTIIVLLTYFQWFIVPKIPIKVELPDMQMKHITFSTWLLVFFKRKYMQITWEKRGILTIWHKLANVALLPRPVLTVKFLKQVSVTLWLTIFVTAQTFPLCVQQKNTTEGTALIDLSLDKQTNRFFPVSLDDIITVLYIPKYFLGNIFSFITSFS